MDRLAGRPHLHSARPLTLLPALNPVWLPRIKVMKGEFALRILIVDDEPGMHESVSYTHLTLPTILLV